MRAAWGRPSFLAPSFAILAFAILALPLALVLATITPLGGVFDETEHAAKAEALSAGEAFGRRGESWWYDLSPHTSAGFDVDATFLTAHEVFALSKVTAAGVREAMGRRWAHARIYVEAAFVARYFPVFYAPAALAIAVAKVARATPYAAFLDARLVNLAVFAGLAVAALLLARRGRALLFCVLALPMTLSLAGSLNQDGLFIGCAALAFALLTRADGGAAGRERVVAAVLIALLGLAKPPYVALAPLLALPLAWRTLPRRAWLAGAAALPGVLWAAYALHAISVPWPPMTRYAAGPLWPGPAGATFTTLDAAAQLRVLAADPLRVVSLTVDSLVGDSSLWRSVVGIFPIGMYLPSGLTLAWTMAFAAAAVGALVGDAPAWRLGLRGRDALLVAASLAATLVAIAMSQYLTWTKVGAEHVDMSGQIGRYLLPLLPFLVLGAPVLEGPRLRAVALALCVPAGVAALIGLAVVPRVVVEAFYLR